MELLEEVLQYIKEMDGETDFQGNETYLHKKVREAIEANKARATGMAELTELEHRSEIVKKLRALAEQSKGLTAALPTLPVEKWLDGTVADATKDVYFENHDLAKLLRFIADVGVSFED